jgi:hypothetical protein
LTPKLKGDGIEDEEIEEPDRGNVVDLMTALKKSLGQGSEEPANPNRTSKAKAEPAAKVPAAQQIGAEACLSRQFFDLDHSQRCRQISRPSSSRQTI